MTQNSDFLAWGLILNFRLKSGLTLVHLCMGRWLSRSQIQNKTFKGTVRDLASNGTWWLLSCILKRCFCVEKVLGKVPESWSNVLLLLVLNGPKYRSSTCFRIISLWAKGQIEFQISSISQSHFLEINTVESRFIHSNANHDILQMITMSKGKLYYLF